MVVPYNGSGGRYYCTLQQLFERGFLVRCLDRGLTPTGRRLVERLFKNSLDQSVDKFIAGVQSSARGYQMWGVDKVLSNLTEQILDSMDPRNRSILETVSARCELAPQALPLLAANYVLAEAVRMNLASTSLGIVTVLREPTGRYELG